MRRSFFLGLQMRISVKLGFLLVILSGTLIYSIYERQTYEELASAPEALILKNLPEFKVKSLADGKDILSTSLTPKTQSGLLFVHLWGTWCAPCEAEFPAFVEFAKKFEKDDVKFLVVAVKDDIKKVKKFLKQFKTLPTNFILALDNEGLIKADLGNTKVPETFLFNSNRQHIRKYIGSQKWETQNHVNYVKRLVGAVKNIKSKIKTH